MVAAGRPPLPATGQRRVALVTGSSRGIGRATALALAESHDIVVHYRRRPDLAEVVAEQVRRAGAQCLIARAELERPEELAELVAATLEQFGRLDAVIANAASGVFKPMLGSSRGNAERTLGTVVLSFFDLMSLTIPHLAAGGRIVAVSGADSHFAVADHALLGAAKAAVDSLVRNLSVECGSRAITVNAVMPGVVRTESLQIGLEGAAAVAEQMLLESIPLGRFAEPAEIAAAIAFLCSPAASYVSGTTLVVDGGMAAGGGPWVAIQRASDRARSGGGE